VLREPLLAHSTEVGDLQRARLTIFQQRCGRSQGNENAKNREHVWTLRRHWCVRETDSVDKRRVATLDRDL
jgi:hypothetical protein